MKNSTRKITIIGDIDHETYLSFSEKLDTFESRSVTKEVYIHLCSPGGDPSVALAIYDRMKLSPCEIVVYATGLVASAASLILIAGDYRFMSESAWVMIHEETPHHSETKNKSVSDLEKISGHYRKMENQWNDLFVKNTKLTFEKSQELHKNETYLSAKECLEYGIVQEVICRSSIK
jgi:ATP-dependent Clp protease, protease subunit